MTQKQHCSRIWCNLPSTYTYGKIEKCYKGDDEAGLRACCRNQGVPYECSGYCTLKEVGKIWMWKCEEWEPQIRKCNEGNCLIIKRLVFFDKINYKYFDQNCKHQTSL